MQAYRRNSPEAAARIVALTLVADGNVCRSEIEAMGQLGIETELGLRAGAFPTVVRALCEDLQLLAYGNPWGDALIGTETLGSLLADVTEPELQRKVLSLASAAVHADRHVSEAETRVLQEASRRWGVDIPSTQATCSATTSR